jgi:hypothetical protein
MGESCGSAAFVEEVVRLPRLEDREYQVLEPGACSRQTHVCLYERTLALIAMSKEKRP